MKKNYSVLDDGTIEIKINREIYPKEILIQASYVLLEKYYFLVDLDENNYIVSIKCKESNKENDSEKIVYEFFDELIESASYVDQLKRTSKIRETILEKALLSQKKIDKE